MPHEMFKFEITISPAAHCVDGEAQNGILVVAGTLLLNSGGVSHQSQRYIMHPEYDDWTLAYE